MGAVTKALVAVTTAIRSPAARCCSTSATASGRSAGRITSAMKRSRIASASSSGRDRQADVAKSM